MTLRSANTMRSCGPLMATTAPEVFESWRQLSTNPPARDSVNPSQLPPFLQETDFSQVSFNDRETKFSDNPLRAFIRNEDAPTRRIKITDASATA